MQPIEPKPYSSPSPQDPRELKTVPIVMPKHPWKRKKAA